MSVILVYELFWYLSRLQRLEKNLSSRNTLNNSDL